MDVEKLDISTNWNKCVVSDVSERDTRNEDCEKVLLLPGVYKTLKENSPFVKRHTSSINY